ncbi:MAG: hypothetical protein KAX93_00610 [Flavobacterium sp.]|nr:hypothetical protein [Flavobacterium sp.]MBP8156857.1 hypothetical protein [Flavobacterium sp.]
MIKKFLKYFKVKEIDVLIYVMKSNAVVDFSTLDFAIESEQVSKNKKRFFIQVEGKVIHESFLFERLFVLRLIDKKGPTIGDCRTVDAFKGKSIYPYVINHIAVEEIGKHNREEVFIIVSPNNLSSIKGIEKAGFKIHTKVTAKRFLFFHFNTNKSYS